jgi:CHAT domain-containing protein
LMVNYKINIASISVKLEQLEEAKRIYTSLLRYKVYENEIWHNIGIIDNRLGNFRQAIDDLRKVKYIGAKSIDLDYNLALAFDSLNQNDSVKFYVRKASIANSQFNASNKSSAWGLVLKFLGDKDREEKRYKEALTNYQQAIIEFDIPFSDPNISGNPTQFTGIFSYINLFKTLTTKAEVFEAMYLENKNITSLESSLAAYRSAFKLADYVEKTYESDESRLFLNDIKYKAHSKPIDVCLRLYELTHEQHYLEEAYFFDQRNKASILAFNLHVGGSTGMFSEIGKKAQELKTSITRLSLKESQADSSQLAEINREISNYEIQLARLQQQLNNDPQYAQIQPSEWIPSISTLQNKILDNHSAIVSYHLSSKSLVLFVVTSKSFSYHQQPVGEEFVNAIKSWVTYLRQVNAGQKYGGDSLSAVLYGFLIKPILSITSKCDRLIVIPDDELNYIPFEALKSESNDYLLQTFSVQYQYSTALLNIQSRTKTNSPTQTLAFAPFVNTDPQNRFDALRYSKSEVEDLEGKIFLGNNATKANFLASANHYKIIHLATHATADDQSPLYSSIVFFPVGPDSSYRLYAQEVYNLRLDSVQLVILSACETGTGQLIRGEGLMSLSRAIAYAGCPNVVTSLWKAEDKTTAFITERLHYYLRKNHSTDKALQEAKLDLIESKAIEPQFKAPSHWAHLIFIGNYQAEERTYWFCWIIVGAVLISTLVFLYLKRKTWLKKPG